MTPSDASALADLIHYIDVDLDAPTGDASGWKAIEPGARRRTLHVDRATKRAIVLVQWDPGYTISYLDTHEHDEFLYILSGTFIDQNRACGPGTFIHNEPGSQHQPTTPDGCTYLAVISPRFTGNDPEATTAAPGADGSA